MKDAQIAVELVEERAIDDANLISGRVSFDDLRVGHVFSPVTGRVVSILGQLGERVKRGQPLAVIESPDIGNAISDEHKAEADLIAAEHEFERQRTLIEQRAASRASLEQSEDRRRKAKAELERARQVDWVNGLLDPASRTAKVRCTLDNADGLLKPEMYATVQISVDQRKALAIPRGALLRLGEYQVVFVQVGASNGYLRHARMPLATLCSVSPEGIAQD